MSEEKSHPSVSIVIPVYNVEAYLGECLDSACRQSLSSIEMICVNDGSTDGSLAIAESYAANDSRIRVISKENGGLSSARNAGIDAARGDIIMFLDSDDLLVGNACEVVADRFVETSAEIVTFGASCFPEDAASTHMKECLSPRDAVYHPFSDKLLFEENSRPYACRSAFKRDFLNAHSIRFCEDIPFGEDQILYFHAYPQASTVSLMSGKLYRYRIIRKGSLMNSARESLADRVGKHVAVAERILSIWTENGWFEKHGWRTLGWLIEFVLLDMSKLDERERVSLKNRYGASLRDALEGVDLEALPLGRMTRRMLERMLDEDDKLSISSFELGRFYIERRGIGACVKRGVEAVLEKGRR